ncbi:MAG TPA: efflux RND transporter periplasmic adaptor subunit [Vicinamibacterales bacterium]|jgi:cobalt-zinc-cadmium efflux system membrane fusion protein
MTRAISGELIRLSVRSLYVWVFVLVPVLVSGCGHRESRARDPATPQPAPASSAGAGPVRTAVVHVAPLSDDLDLAASVQTDPTRVIRLFPPVSGRVIGVFVRPSQYVRRGQAIAELASSDIASARAAYEEAQADAQVKQLTFRRAADLYAHRAIALKEYQQAEAESQMAEATLTSATEHLTLLGVDRTGSSDRITVRAPRTGTILDLAAADGEFAKSLDNANPICTMADLSVVWAVGEVFEQDLARIRIGSAATLTVDAFPGRTWRGQVDAVSSTVDPTARTISVRIVLPNPGFMLKPNMFGRVSVKDRGRATVVVPQTAVLREGDASYVFVRSPSGSFLRQPVEIGRDLAGRVEVVSGLTSGETIAITGADLLQSARDAS